MTFLVVSKLALASTSWIFALLRWHENAMRVSVLLAAKEIFVCGILLVRLDQIMLEVVRLEGLWFLYITFHSENDLVIT